MLVYAIREMTRGKIICLVPTSENIDKFMWAIDGENIYIYLMNCISQEKK